MNNCCIKNCSTLKKVLKRKQSKAGGQSVDAACSQPKQCDENQFSFIQDEEGNDDIETLKKFITEMGQEAQNGKGEVKTDKRDNKKESPTPLPPEAGDIRESVKQSSLEKSRCSARQEKVDSEEEETIVQTLGETGEGIHVGAGKEKNDEQDQAKKSDTPSLPGASGIYASRTSICKPSSLAEHENKDIEKDFEQLKQKVIKSRKEVLKRPPKEKRDKLRCKKQSNTKYPWTSSIDDNVKLDEENSKKKIETPSPSETRHESINRSRIKEPDTRSQQEKMKGEDEGILVKTLKKTGDKIRVGHDEIKLDELQFKKGSPIHFPSETSNLQENISLEDMKKPFNSAQEKGDSVDEGILGKSLKETEDAINMGFVEIKQQENEDSNEKITDQILEEMADEIFAGPGHTKLYERDHTKELPTASPPRPGSLHTSITRSSMEKPFNSDQPDELENHDKNLDKILKDRDEMNVEPSEIKQDEQDIKKGSPIFSPSGSGSLKSISRTRMQEPFYSIREKLESDDEVILDKILEETRGGIHVVPGDIKLFERDHKKESQTVSSPGTDNIRENVTEFSIEKLKQEKMESDDNNQDKIFEETGVKICVGPGAIKQDERDLKKEPPIPSPSGTGSLRESITGSSIKKLEAASHEKVDCDDEETPGRTLIQTGEEVGERDPKKISQTPSLSATSSIHDTSRSGNDKPLSCAPPELKKSIKDFEQFKQMLRGEARHKRRTCTKSKGSIIADNYVNIHKRDRKKQSQTSLPSGTSSIHASRSSNDKPAYCDQSELKGGKNDSERFKEMFKQTVDELARRLPKVKSGEVGRKNQKQTGKVRVDKRHHRNKSHTTAYAEFSDLLRNIPVSPSKLSKITEFFLNPGLLRGTKRGKLSTRIQALQKVLKTLNIPAGGISQERQTHEILKTTAYLKSCLAGQKLSETETESQWEERELEERRRTMLRESPRVPPLERHNVTDMFRSPPRTPTCTRWFLND